LDVVAEAADGEEAVKRALQDDIDLAVLDISMPRKTGLQAALEHGRRRPELRIEFGRRPPFQAGLSR